MRKSLTLFTALLLCTSALSAAAVPVFGTGDRVAVEVAEGSREYTALRAAKGELSEEWFEKWTTGESLLRTSGWKTLDGLFPLEDAVVLEEKDGAVAVYSMKSGVLVSFTFDEDRICAVSVIGLD